MDDDHSDHSMGSGVSSPRDGGSVSAPRVMLPASCDPPLPGVPTKPKVWIVFGGTGHIGRSVVRSALAHGDYVATVGRTMETSPAGIKALAEATEQATAEAPGAAHAAAGSRCLGLLCDVRSRGSVDRVVRRALSHFGGRLDVVANCSGYGVVGACEDQDEHALRNQFETNFMGTVHILHATLPWLRQRGQGQGQGHEEGGGGGGTNIKQGGRYLIFSSTAGALGVPGLGPYCATKYAVEGLVEALLYEVDASGIRATLVEPGIVRRDDPPHNNDRLPTWGHFLLQPPSEPYAEASSPALHQRRIVQWLGDRQPTSAVQCAELVWQLAHCSFPPVRLPLGSYAIESIRDRLRSVTEELEDWKHLHFPPPPELAAVGAAGGAGASVGEKTPDAGSKPEADKESKEPKEPKESKVVSDTKEPDHEMTDANGVAV